jgi:hypothetical protein
MCALLAEAAAGRDFKTRVEKQFRKVVLDSSFME